MHPTAPARRLAPAAAALALVVLLAGCTCFDPTLRFDLNPTVPASIAAPLQVATSP
jgi:hypothetical protein